MLTLDKIYHAAFVLKDVARKTDLIEAPKLSKDCRLYLKTENLQVTGSFKVRGAYYKISQLSREESEKDGNIKPGSNNLNRPETTHRAWLWPPPAGASGASSVCRTVPPL